MPAIALLMVVVGMGACEPPPAGKTPSTPAPAEPPPSSGAPDASEPPGPSASVSSDNGRPPSTAQPAGSASPAGDGQTPAGAGSAQAGNPPGCPGSFREASGLQVDCEQPAVDLCAYPEGACACDAPRQCGGMRRERVLSWSCKPKPLAVRSDGCPGELPKSGEACAPEGKRCRYHRCDPSVECRGGRWQRRSRKRRRSRP